ncbi:protein SCO1/2 [Halobiforma haloterrestris]|uniref:Protein SCO1/2 n=1 Tax=Natronobacterium haloterrestre TaxID=148448 RepID=A0A1I1FMQ6_NATHA|nr:SCO family protein [Halobiforma haloterrestris]SFB98938.1 protein SCO1/2 [Halobiforma haloterrestris]
MTPTSTSTSVDRRTILRATGAAALGTSLAGCSQLTSSDNGADGVVLDPPENHERIKESDIPHPIYGEEIPEATVPAPLHDRSVTTTEFEGDRHVMLTFIYTSCTTVCPGLTAALRRVQADAHEEGYEGEIAFLPITFDPEYDTPEVLEAYGEDYGVDFDAGNWYFLRPETHEDAKGVVEDTFGVAFEHGEESGDMDHDESDEMDDEEMNHERHITHTSLILLVNKDGLVERAWTGGSPGGNEIVDAARAVVEGW